MTDNIYCKTAYISTMTLYYVFAIIAEDEKAKTLVSVVPFKGKLHNRWTVIYVSNIVL